MASHSLPHLSPEQEFGHKLAAQELAKYLQEFSRWRKSKRRAFLANSVFKETSPAPVKPSSTIPTLTRFGERTRPSIETT